MRTARTRRVRVWPRAHFNAFFFFLPFSPQRCKSLNGDESGWSEDLLPPLSVSFCQVIRQALDKYIVLIPNPGRVPQFAPLPALAPII